MVRAANVVNGISFNRSTDDALSREKLVLQIQLASTLGLRQINLQNRNPRNHPLCSKNSLL